MIQVGIIGLGRMGILHSDVINGVSNGSVVAVCEKELLLRKMAKKILPSVHFYESPSEMLRTEALDAIFVTTPIQTHVPVLEEVLSSQTNRIAVFCEKPLAGNYSDALRISQEFAESITMVGFQKRRSALFSKAKELLENNAIGDILFFKSYGYLTDVFKRNKGWRYEKGTGGVLLDFGVHLVDLIEWFFGEPDVVKSFESSFFSEAEDYVHCFMKFSRGFIGSLDVCWSMRNYRLPEMGIEIHGTNGLIIVNDDFLKIELDAKVNGIMDEGKHMFYKPALNTSVDFFMGDPEYTLEDQAFLDAVISKKKCTPDFCDAAKANKLISQIHKEAGN